MLCCQYPLKRDITKTYNETVQPSVVDYSIIHNGKVYRWMITHTYIASVLNCADLPSCHGWANFGPLVAKTLRRGISAELSPQESFLRTSSWMTGSVRLSVRPSVTPFSPCSHHRIIMKLSGVITTDKSDVHAKVQGQRSKVKVTEVNTQLNRFWTVTQVWIHIWWWNDAYSLMMLRRGALLFFKVIRQISRPHGSKIRHIWPRLGVSEL